MRVTTKRVLAAALSGLLAGSMLIGCTTPGVNGGMPVPTHTPAPTQGAVQTPEPTMAPQETLVPQVTQIPEDISLPKIWEWDGVTVTDRRNAAVASLTGDGIYVEKEGKNAVLVSEGKDGYLELPENIWSDVSEGFTVAYRFKADKDAADNAKVFQTNLCGYGMGDTQWRDAPEISLSVDGTLRIYVGGRTINGVYNANATYNNGIAGVDDKAYAEPGGHKTRYEASTAALTKGEWHEVILSVSKTGVQLYFDGQKAELKQKDATYDLTSSLDYLLNTYKDGKLLIADYLCTSFGNSVYSDEPNFKGCIDTVEIYQEALTAEELLADAKEPIYSWDFEGDMLAEAEPAELDTDPSWYLGKTKLTEVTKLAVTSPDEETTVQIWMDAKGSYYYSVVDGGQTVIETSAIGLELKEADLSEGLSVRSGSIVTTAVNETYELFTGNSATVTDHCNELRFVLENTAGCFTFEISVHDDGFAYRYTDVTAGTGEKVTVLDEISEVILPESATTWAFELNGHYEGTYIKRNHKQLTALEQKLSTPMLAKFGDYWMVMTEASVINNNGEYCASALGTTRGSAVLNWSFGQRRDPAREAKGDLDFPGMLPITEVTTVNGFTTPWRAFVFSMDLNELVNSSLITDLNDTADTALFADTSYIKPGKVAWSWWAEEGAQGTYSKHIEYIDFAAKNGWDYVCLDVGWRSFERKLPELCAYAKEKGVGVFVWVNYRDIKDANRMEQLFSKWKAAGIVGLKTDYFESDEQSVLTVMQSIAEWCAKNQLMVLYHGCVRPGGECRTYPNILSTEAVYGEENHKWSEEPTVTNCLLYPFVRNICGSMDYTPAGTKVDSEATYGFCLAQTVVYESALQHFAYAAASYEKYNGLAFLNQVPTEWDESVLLDGEPGEHVTYARRNGDNWFIGSMTKEERSVNISLEFLESGFYNFYIYEDREDGTGLVHRELRLEKEDVLTLNLKNGGGAAVMITKGTMDTTVGEDESVNPAGYAYYEAEQRDNTLNGAAVRASSAFCSGNQKVGYIGYAGNSLVINNIIVEADGTYKLLLYYCSGENRKLTVTVNGTDTYEMQRLNSGDFVHTAVAELEIVLKAGSNRIEFSNPSYYAPDIDRIAISQTTVK